MANNRMWLTCTVCKENEFIDTNNSFLLAKYYPSTNWYMWTRGSFQGLPRANDRLTEFDGFMAKHTHDSDKWDINDGPTHFKIEYEVE